MKISSCKNRAETAAKICVFPGFLHGFADWHHFNRANQRLGCLTGNPWRKSDIQIQREFPIQMNLARNAIGF